MPRLPPLPLFLLISALTLTAYLPPNQLGAVAAHSSSKIPAGGGHAVASARDLVRITNFFSQAFRGGGGLKGIAARKGGLMSELGPNGKRLLNEMISQLKGAGDVKRMKKMVFERLRSEKGALLPKIKAALAHNRDGNVKTKLQDALRSLKKPDGAKRFDGHKGRAGGDEGNKVVKGRHNRHRGTHSATAGKHTPPSSKGLQPAGPGQAQPGINSLLPIPSTGGLFTGFPGLFSGGLGMGGFGGGGAFSSGGTRTTTTTTTGTTTTGTTTPPQQQNGQTTPQDAVEEELNKLHAMLSFFKEHVQNAASLQDLEEQPVRDKITNSPNYANRGLETSPPPLFDYLKEEREKLDPNGQNFPPNVVAAQVGHRLVEHVGQQLLTHQQATPDVANRQSYQKLKALGEEVMRETDAVINSGGATP